MRNFSHRFNLAKTSIISYFSILFFLASKTLTMQVSVFQACFQCQYVWKSRRDKGRKNIPLTLIPGPLPQASGDVFGTKLRARWTPALLRQCMRGDGSRNSALENVGKSRLCYIDETAVYGCLFSTGNNVAYPRQVSRLTYTARF